MPDMTRGGASLKYLAYLLISRQYLCFCNILALLHTGVEVFIGSKVQCLLCFETCAADWRGGEKHTEPLTQEMPRPLYTWLQSIVR